MYVQYNLSPDSKGGAHRASLSLLNHSLGSMFMSLANFSDKHLKLLNIVEPSVIISALGASRSLDVLL